MTKTYFVEGMTCQHCVASVTEEINEVPGAQGVEVDLDAGRVTVTGDDFTDADIHAAITEAGYSVTEN